MVKVRCDGWRGYYCKRWPGHEGSCALVPRWWMRPIEWAVLRVWARHGG